MVNKTKGIGMLFALVLAVTVLPVMAEDNETTLSTVTENGNETSFLMLANGTISIMSVEDSHPVESGSVLFPAEDNFIFAGKEYTVVWTRDWQPDHVSIGIMPVENGTITWLCIMEDWPCDDRWEFCAPLLDSGTYRTVIVLDHDGIQEDILGDTFSLINESVYIPPPEPEPEW